MKRWLTAALAVIAFWAVFGAASPAHATPFNGALLPSCNFGEVKQVDPIVNWAQPLSHHLHAYLGSTAVAADTTFPKVLAGGTTCDVKTDKNMWWMPTIVKPDGSTVAPGRSSYYIRGAARGEPVHAFPQGFRWISGNPANTTTFGAAAVWTCPGWNARTIPTDCGGKGIQMTQYLTHCWDGKNYGPGLGGTGGPANGRDHMAAAVNTAAGPRCPASHPVVVPGIQLIVNWPPEAVGGRLSSDAPGAPAGSSFHSDFLVAFDLNSKHENGFERITSMCLNVDAVSGGPLTCTNGSDGTIKTTAANPSYPAGTFVTD